MSFSSNEKNFGIVATGMAGLVTGALTFVSFVDVRSFWEHVDQKQTGVIQAHFPVWWPNGRDLMIPLLVGATLSHGGAYYASNNNRSWLVSGLFLLLIGPYTKVLLGEDIETLRKSNQPEVAETTRRFCRYHHGRLVIAAAAFGLSLVSLADL